MDNAGITSHHWKIMLISGMGFFTDAYDLFIIDVVMALLKPIWHVGKLEESLVASTALLAAALHRKRCGDPFEAGFDPQRSDPFWKQFQCCLCDRAIIGGNERDDRRFRMMSQPQMPSMSKVSVIGDLYVCQS